MNALYSNRFPVRRVEPIGREDLNVPTADSVPKPLIVDKATQCFVTPLAVGWRMAGLIPAPSDGELTVLEPSAGTGNLIQAMLDSGYGCHNITAVERNSELCDFLDREFEGLNPVQDCFLNYSASTRTRFDRIIVNPPFKGVKAHMNAAFSLLKPNGIMVALVPLSYQHDAAVTIETLPTDTFQGIKVATKIIQFGVTHL